MIGLNLLPDVKKEFIKAQRTRNTVISLSILSMFIAGGLTVFLALFVYVGQNTAINAVKADIDTKQVTLEGKAEIAKYLTIQNQLGTLKVLEGKEYRILYSRLFDYLLQLNPAAPNSVQLGSLKVLADGTSINVQGTTSDFHALDTFKNTLEKSMLSFSSGDETQEVNLFSKVNLKTAALSQSNAKSFVSFEFELTYSAEIFSPDVTQFQLTIPKQVISDSQNNAPSQLFGASEGSN
jgi:hypothetical protein